MVTQKHCYIKVGDPELKIKRKLGAVLVTLATKHGRAHVTNRHSVISSLISCRRPKPTLFLARESTIANTRVYGDDDTGVLSSDENTGRCWQYEDKQERQRSMMRQSTSLHKMKTQEEAREGQRKTERAQNQLCDRQEPLPPSSEMKSPAWTDKTDNGVSQRQCSHWVYRRIKAGQPTRRRDDLWRKSLIEGNAGESTRTNLQIYSSKVHCACTAGGATFNVLPLLSAHRHQLPCNFLHRHDSHVPCPHSRKWSSAGSQSS